MPPAKSANPAPRKRTRKRKRRAVSVSSSSSSSESSSSEEEKSSPETVRKIPETPKPVESESESESDSDSDSDTSDSSSSIVGPSKDGLPEPGPIPSQKPNELHRSPSLSPPPAKIPSFLPPQGDPNAEEKEKEMKEKFRKFWMSSVADGFRDDLEELRKVRVQLLTLEPNLGTGRLALLIDSLASGSEVFSSKADGDVSEMDVMMGS